MRGTRGIFHAEYVSALLFRIAREVLDIAAAALRPGITGTELDAIVYSATIERGCYPSPLNYHGFPKSVCVSVNEVCAHWRVLQRTQAAP